MERIKQFMARAPKGARDRGASLVEYALLVALIAVVCIAAVTQLGNNTSDSHQAAADGLSDTGDNCPDGQHRGDSSHLWAGHPNEGPEGCYEDGPVGGFHNIVGMYPG